MTPLTPFQRRKLAARFALLDHDGDGRLTEADLLALAEQLCDRLHPPAELEHELRAACRKLWTRMTEADADGDGTITLEEYTQVATAHPHSTVIRLVDAVFRTLDTDGSGSLDTSEYTVLLEAAGGDPADAAAVVARLDLDGNGTIEIEAFRAACLDYFTGTDPTAAGNWVFGRPA